MFNATKAYHDAYHYLVYAIRSFESFEKKSPMIRGQIAAAKIELAQSARMLEETSTAENLLIEVDEDLHISPELSYLRFWFFLESAYFHLSQGESEQSLHFLEDAKALVQNPTEEKAYKLALEIIDAN